MNTAYREKIVEAAKEILKFHGYFVDILWHVDDIYFICEQTELPVVNNQEAMQIFEIAAQQYDGEVGLSWPQLESALRHYLKERDLSQLGSVRCSTASASESV